MKKEGLRCRCGNLLGHIAYTYCFKNKVGKYKCYDIYRIECWWCGFNRIEYVMGIDDGHELEIRQWAMKTFDLRSIGITEQDLGGVVPIE